MGVLEKLSRFVGGSAAVARDAAAALEECYCDCVRRARQLGRHAELAPQQCSIEGLEDLVAEEERQAQRLREALQAANREIPEVASEELPPGGLNHWARLVQDLQAHRASSQRLRELAIRFAEELPSTADLFDQLCREEVIHCEHLRGLIARADPQALD